MTLREASDNHTECPETATIHFGRMDDISFDGGNGTEENPYLLSNAAQLNVVKEDLMAHYVQTADIDLSSMDWKPIGYMPRDEDAVTFSGSYNGNGFTISNLTIQETSKENECAGLFGANTGALRNIQLENVDINLDIPKDCKHAYVGGIAGYSKGSIDNCTVSGSIRVNLGVYIKDKSEYEGYTPDLTVGGVVGSGNCSDCINYAAIYATGEYEIEYMSNHESVTVTCGGIVGQPTSINSEIRNCINYGDVYASADGFALAGGISGQYGSIHSCVNYGNITSNAKALEVATSTHVQSNAGGIVGVTHAKISSNCINFGNISAQKTCDEAGCSAGGISGCIGYESSGDLSNCYNLGNVHSTPQIPENPESDSYVRVGAIYGMWYWWDGELRATDSYSLNSTKITDKNVDNVEGYDGILTSAKEMNIKIKDIMLSLGLPWEEIEDEISENATVRYFREWDAETQTAYWGEEPPIVEGLDLGSQVTEETDTSFLANVDSLVGTYVLVETRARDDGMIAADILLSVRPLETKNGTITDMDSDSITIDGVEYPLPESVNIYSIDVGDEIMYHLYNGVLVGIDGQGNTESDPDSPTEPSNKEYRFVLSPDADNLTVATGQSIEIECYLFCGDEIVPVWDKPDLQFQYVDGNEPMDDVLQYVGWKECENGYAFTFKGIAIGTASIMLIDDASGAELKATITVTSDIEEGDTIRKEWIQQHMEYAASDTYQTDIVPGYQGLMYDEFKKIMDDPGIKLYDATDALANFLNANPSSIDQSDLYELLLAELMYSSLNEDAITEAYTSNLQESSTKVLKEIWSVVTGSMKLVKDADSQKLKDAIAIVETAQYGSKEFVNANDQFLTIIESNCTPDQLSKAFSSAMTNLGFSLAFDAITQVGSSAESMIEYMYHVAAYSATSDDFKRVMSTLEDKVISDLSADDFPALSSREQDINWAELAKALNSYVSSMEKFEEEGMEAIVDKLHEEIASGTEAFAEKAKRTMARTTFDLLIQAIPIVNMYPTVRTSLKMGMLVIDMFTGIDDQSSRLDMATKLYCLSVALDNVTDDFANMMDEDYFWVSTTFDESVSLYKAVMLKAIGYLAEYEKSDFASAYRQNTTYWGDEGDRMARHWLLMDRLANEEDRIMSILCHDSDWDYDSSRDIVITPYEDSVLYVVACPVDVIITSDEGKQIAYLSNESTEVAEGYEWYYYTAKADADETLKIAVVPDGYSIELSGTDVGTMNAFAAEFDAEKKIDVRYFHAIPVEKGSTGYFDVDVKDGVKLIFDGNQQQESDGEYFHVYELSNFNWSDDYSCVATFECESGDDTQVVECVVTSSTTPATESTDGKIVYTATVEFCGQTYSDAKTVTIPATGHTNHTAGTAWLSDSSNHWHKCTGCDEKLDLAAHSGGTATCVKTAVCSVCGTSYGDKDNTNHSFTKYVSDENATCKKDGTKTAKCDYGCGKTDTVTDKGSKLGHKYKDGECVRCGVSWWNPDTGDKIMIAVTALVVSGAGILLLVLRRKNKK